MTLAQSSPVDTRAIVERDRVAARQRTLRINPDRLTATVNEIHCRIVERFPTADLRTVAARIALMVEGVTGRVRSDARAGMFARFLLLLIVVVLLGGGGYVAATLGPTMTIPSWTELVQVGEAGLQLLILLGLGMLWCWSSARRARRARQLGYLSELRGIVHILDLYQLDKDPDRLFRAPSASTESSPKLGDVNNAFLMGRYLDYVSELLAVVSTLAAYYADETDDDAVLGVVREIGSIAASHRVHIGQKAAVLAAHHGVGSAPLTA